MRTTAEEMTELGARIGRKAAAATGPAEVFWPERGVSALDADGQPLWDPVADAACLEALDTARVRATFRLGYRRMMPNLPLLSSARQQRSCLVSHIRIRRPGGCVLDPPAARGAAWPPTAACPSRHSSPAAPPPPPHSPP